MPKVENILRALADTPDSSRHSVIHAAQCNMPKPMADNDIFDEFCRQIIGLQYEGLIAFYQFFPNYRNCEVIIKSIKDKSAESRERKVKVTLHILINQRSGLAAKLYKESEPTGLEDLAKDVNNEFFELQVGYHKTGLMASYHAKYGIFDGIRMIVCGCDPQEANNPEFCRHESGILFSSSQLAQIFKNEFIEIWDKHVLGKDSQPHGKSSRRHRSLKFDHGGGVPEVPLEDDPETKDAGAQHIAGAQITKMVLLSVFAKSVPSVLKSLFYSRSSPSTFKIALLAAINDAKRNIDIVTPNFNDPDIIRAVQLALARGVNVRIVISKHHNDSLEKHVGGTNVDAMKRLLDGVAVEHRKNLQLRWSCNRETREIVPHKGKYTNHAKVCIVDQELMLTGSSPLDLQGTCNSRELDACYDLTPQAASDAYDLLVGEHFIHGRDYFVDLAIESFELLLKELQKDLGISIQEPQMESDTKWHLQLLINTIHTLTDNLKRPGLNIQDAKQILENVRLLELPEEALVAAHKMHKMIAGTLSQHRQAFEDMGDQPLREVDVAGLRQVGDRLLAAMKPTGMDNDINAAAQDEKEAGMGVPPGLSS